MPAEIYQVWDDPIATNKSRQTIDTRERCRALAARGHFSPSAQLVGEIVACSHKEAVAFWRRIERSRRPRREGDD